MRFDRKTVSAFLVIILLITLAYGNSLKGDFHFDDYINIHKNYSTHIHELGELTQVKNRGGGLTRRIGFLTFALNYYFSGLDPVGFHITNILIHICSGVFVFCIVSLTLSLRKFRKIPENRIFAISLFTALLWALNPIQTQAVTYIVQRLTSLAGMFTLGSLFLYIKARRCFNCGLKKPALYMGAASLLMYILGVFSKEVAVTLPGFLLIYEYLFFRGIETFTVKRFLQFLGMGLIFIVIITLLRPHSIDYISEGYKTRQFTMYERVLTEFRIVVRYVTLILLPLPSRLNLDYNYLISTDIFSPITTLFSMLFVFGAFGYSLLTVKKDPLISFCILWFLGNLVIESTIVPLELIFEHRNYIPSFGIILMVVVLLFRILDKNTGYLKQTDET